MSGLLKFITCGSVDDGKSTLIGHILYDSKLLYADQEKALLLDSKVGSRGGEIDYSLLLDGLMAEREQGITIDVAYRYFTTERRSFIVADTPGHEEYTRNMAVGASFANLAVILVDAKQGVLVQTRRHSRICALMGIHHFVFAVNKMDLADYQEERFNEIKKEILALSKELSLKNIKIIPVSATEGDNVTKRSDRMDWYQGETLMEHLETVDISESENLDDFYLPVQRVCRPNHEFRGFQGQIESGKVKTGQKLYSLPSSESARVERILVGVKEVSEAFYGQAVTIQLDREVDVSRGCVLTDNESLPIGKNIKASLLWMDDEPLSAAKNYLIKLGTKRLPAIIKKIEYKVDVNTGEHIKTDRGVKNEILFCEIECSENVVADLFKNHKTLGELILIDRLSHMTSACGVVEHVECQTKKPYFEKDSIWAEGYIFEEFYFNLEHAFLSKPNSADTTYHVGDAVPIKGDSFHYPEYFDIIDVERSAAILIRGAFIKDIISLTEYEYSGLPVLDERGFALLVTSKKDVDRFFKEYNLLEKDNRVAFVNKWSKFETYRSVVCNDNYWMI